VAAQLAAQGARVIVAGRRQARLDEVAASLGGGARGVVCDVASADSVAALAREVGACDILVNNAGIAKSAPLARTDDAMWAETLAVNLTGTFLCTRAFLPGMTERGWGRVVNVASIAGKAGMAYTSAYCASKHGVLGFTRAVALECARRGVTVNAVCPGWVDTEMTDGSVANIQDKAKMTEADARAYLAAQSPQNRLMTAGEVASLVVFLCGEAAAGITAQALNVDGGQLQS
jgi:NAD(P)-dependent dehydrogenase (short-subunit alcohol dehydrogenase family)